jgi:hypothetical protein
MQNAENNTGNTAYATMKNTPVTKDAMGLTSGQRTFAWVALAAGVLALVFAMMRNPDNGQGYDASTDNRGTSTMNDGAR